MKPAIIVAFLLTGLALAGPVKRALVTEWEIETVTVVVTVPPSSKATTRRPRPTRVTSLTTTAAALIKSTASSAPAVVAVPSSPATSGQSTGDSSNLPAYAAAILEQHNIHRANHSVNSLVWDDYLVGVAKQIAETCVYAHSRAFGDGDYGQNIGAGAPHSDVPKMITNDMYNGEITHYPGYGGEPDMGNFEVWGHFSQIVWSQTKSVGCYTAKCSSLKGVSGNVAPYFTVCNYKPSGNYIGQFSKNVFQPKGQKSVVL